MSSETHLFIDFDNTLVDMASHRERYVVRVAEIASTEFGGETATWIAVLVRELGATLEAYARRFTGDPLAGFNAWLEEERIAVTTRVFDGVGKPLPSRETVSDLAKRLQFETLSTIDALNPGAAAALKDLKDMDVQIHMASAQESEYLRASVLAGGIELLVDTLHGPDLIDCAKEGPEFYRRIMEACCIWPSQAIVLDDQAMCLDWAEEAGARVVQAALLPDSPELEFPVVLRRFEDLPRLIRMGLT